MKHKHTKQETQEYRQRMSNEIISELKDYLHRLNKKEILFITKMSENLLRERPNRISFRQLGWLIGLKKRVCHS